ncbi:MAG: DUF4173 domain-containing protein [Clostridiales Family XIII bacterium]|jgi:hypothetical protein|nr:DUF4173 domain-containing protein [Clostridiales Family XIII bacterium]
MSILNGKTPGKNAPDEKISDEKPSDLKNPRGNSSDEKTPDEKLSSEKTAPVFDAADKALIPGMLVCGFFYFEWIAFIHMPALGVSLFTALICGITLLYFNKRGVRQGRGSLPYLVILCLSCVQFAIFDSNGLQFFNFVFMAFVYLYWTSASCGTRISGGLSGYALFDALNQSVVTPFGNFIMIFSGLRRSIREMKRGGEFVNAVLGILVFLPLIAAVLSLLSNADDAFASLWDEIRNLFYMPDIIDYAFEFILGIPVAAYLYGAVFGNAAKRRTGTLDAGTISAGLTRIRLVPGMAFSAPIAAFNVCYALFFVALGNYFFSAFHGRLPEAVSYAEYARKGFFELCGVAAINLAIIATVYLLVRHRETARPRGLRLMTGIMSAFTVLLIITAASKMLLYISTYGLTRLRVYTTWFMLLLLITFLLLLLWHFRAFDPIKPLIIVFAVGFIALTWANTDGLIARHNIAQYENGKTDALDVEMLETLSDAAVPYMYAAWKNEMESAIRATRAQGLSNAEAERMLGEWEENPDERDKLRNELQKSIFNAELTQDDPKIQTVLELERALIWAGEISYRQSEFSEWNLQSFRAKGIGEEVFQTILSSRLL